MIIKSITSPADYDLLGSIGANTEFVPAAGSNAPICPPTYMPPKGRTAWMDRLAWTPGMTMPTRESGWTDIARNADGSAQRSDAVLINSVAAESHKFSDILTDTGLFTGRMIVAPWTRARAEQFLDDNAFILQGVADSDTMREAIIDALTTTVSDSWEASHRYADGVFRIAEDPATGKQVWQGGELKRAMLTANATRDVTWLWRNAANALLFGVWVSNSRSGFRPKWARSVTSEIFGYGATPVVTGTVKGSSIGEVSSRQMVDFDEHGALAVLREVPAHIEKITAKDKRDEALKPYRPSVHGLGQIPTEPSASGVSCEVILRRSGISLNHLRSVRVTRERADFKSAEQAVVRAAAAAGVYALAASSGQGVFLRSGTDLSPASTVWTARSTSGEKIDLEVTVDGARDVLDEAMDDLEKLGLGQADPIELNMSIAQAELIARTAVLSGDGQTEGN